MKILVLVLGSLGLVFLAPAEEENSSQRLEKAQTGMAEGSWPRKPDSRLSPLSGKMKEMTEISPRFFGQDKEFRAKEAGEWQKEARVGSGKTWDRSAGHPWEEARWNQTGTWEEGAAKNEKFQPVPRQDAERLLVYRELERSAAPDWSSRPSRMGGLVDGSLRMYEGRLTRVREQVWREEQPVRDLGPSRQERFKPEEVEKMLSEPRQASDRGLRGQSAKASPPAIAGN